MAPNNPLSTWGNEKTMNLNPLILTNIQSSPYFKVNLYELKTYHEVIDEIYYKVSHLEPWEKGSRKTAGQTGMCGGVRGVGAGGIVSSAYCLLYKLFTLKLTRKQVIGLLTHVDSGYIRGLGFMYIRYTQPPQDLWTWFEEYLHDDEEVDVKAGGGCVLAIGEMLRQFLTKLEWFSTLFPRIPVPVQKSINSKMQTLPPFQREPEPAAAEHIPDASVPFGKAERQATSRPDNNSPDSDGRSGKSIRRSPAPGRRSPNQRPSPPRRSPLDRRPTSAEQERRRPSPELRRPSPERRRPSPERRRPSPEHKRHSPERRRPSPERKRPSPERRRPSPERRRPSPHHRSSPVRSSDDFSRELAREKERQRREKDGDDLSYRSRSRERPHRDSDKRSRHRSCSREHRRHKERDGRREKPGHRPHHHRNGDH